MNSGDSYLPKETRHQESGFRYILAAQTGLCLGTRVCTSTICKEIRERFESGGWGLGENSMHFSRECFEETQTAAQSRALVSSVLVLGTRPR